MYITEVMGISMGVSRHFLYNSILNRKYLIVHNFRLNNINDFILEYKIFGENKNEINYGQTKFIQISTKNIMPEI